MKGNIIKIFVIILVLSPVKLYSQDTVRISLIEAIDIGVSRSVDAIVAKNEFISSYWAYRTYKTELLPNISLTGTVPYYSKTYNAYQDNDGEYYYVSNNYNRIDGAVNISQNIPLTGGKLSASTSYQSLKQYGSNSPTRYKSVPFTFSVQQPIFGFNSLKWQQRIEPIKYTEAMKKLVSDGENVAYTVVNYYFSLLLGQINTEIARQNLRNSEKLYEISEARRKMGQLSENDLLRMRVSLLEAESNLTSAIASFDTYMFQLRSYLGFGEDIILEPVIPGFIAEDIPVLSYPEVLDLAIKNNAYTETLQRRLLEAARSVDQTKANRRTINLNASVGMSGTDNSFTGAYSNHNWRGDQFISIGVSIPIVDWGKSKANMRTAQATQQVVKAQVEKARIDFNQNILLYVQSFNNQPQQVRIAKEADLIAQKHYDTSVEAFVLGKIDILSLNDSQKSKDEARRKYIQEMQSLWLDYYNIRSLTLYDFINERELATEYELNYR